MGIYSFCEPAGFEEFCFFEKRNLLDLPHIQRHILAHSLSSFRDRGKINLDDVIVDMNKKISHLDETAINIENYNGYNEDLQHVESCLSYYRYVLSCMDENSDFIESYLGK